MVLKKIIPAITIALCLISCEQQVNVLKKKNIKFEIILKKQGSNQEINMYRDMVSLSSPPGRILNDRLYFRSNRNSGFVLRIDTSSNEALMIASKYYEPEIYAIEEIRDPNLKNEKIINKNKIKVKTSKYAFNFIADFCPNNNNDIYVFDITLPKEEKKKVIQVNRYQRRRVTQPQNNNTVEKTNRYVLKFNQDGKLVYKLGISGINGKPFDSEKSVVKMMCDQEDNFYLLLRSPAKYDEKGKLVKKKKYEIYKYNSEGRLVYHYTNLKSYLPEMKEHYFLIDDLDISRDGDEIIVLLSYYKKNNGSKDKGVRPVLKKIYSIQKQRNKFVAKLVRVLEKSGKYYSFFAMTSSGKIILNIPDTDKKESMSYMTYRFQVLDEQGKNHGIIKLFLERNPSDRWHWLSPDDSGGVLVLTESEKHYFCQLYR
ncbi:MAG: hypothetical protein OEZ36_01920 [Spirochaetota bacterium]|nr:hypothetical protein [Spirochaetota bacterium]